MRVLVNDSLGENVNVGDGVCIVRDRLMLGEPFEKDTEIDAWLLGGGERF